MLPFDFVVTFFGKHVTFFLDLAFKVHSTWKCITNKNMSLNASKTSAGSSGIQLRGDKSYTIIKRKHYISEYKLVHR